MLPPCRVPASGDARPHRCQCNDVLPLCKVLCCSKCGVSGCSSNCRCSSECSYVRASTTKAMQHLVLKLCSTKYFISISAKKRHASASLRWRTETDLGPRLTGTRVDDLRGIRVKGMTTKAVQPKRACRVAPSQRRCPRRRRRSSKRNKRQLRLGLERLLVHHRLLVDEVARRLDQRQHLRDVRGPVLEHFVGPLGLREHYDTLRPVDLGI